MEEGFITVIYVVFLFSYLTVKVSFITILFSLFVEML